MTGDLVPVRARAEVLPYRPPARRPVDVRPAVALAGLTAGLGVTVSVVLSALAAVAPWMVLAVGFPVLVAGGLVASVCRPRYRSGYVEPSRGGCRCEVDVHVRVRCGRG